MTTKNEAQDDEVYQQLTNDRTKAAVAERTVGDAERVDDPRTAIRYVGEDRGVDQFQVAFTKTTGFPIGKTKRSTQPENHIRDWIDKNDAEIVDAREEELFAPTASEDSIGVVIETDGGHRDVERMTVEELREEYDPLGENRDAVSPGGHDRQMEIWNELRDRVDVEQPECPECGAQDWGQSPGEPKTCNGCGMPLGMDHADLAEDIQQAFNEILSGDGSDEKELVTDGGSTTFEAITLFDRENGEKSMKYGRHEGETYFTDDNDIAEEDAEIVELDEPKTAEALSAWGVEDYPERVQQFFGVEVEA